MTRDTLRETLESWRAQGIPVDEERRERLRESTVERIREAMGQAGEAHRRRNWATGALLAAIAGIGAAAVVLLVSFGMRPTSAVSTTSIALQGEVFALSGDAQATVERDGQQLSLQRERIALAAGDRVQAGPAAEVGMALPDAGRATLTPGSALAVTRARHTEQSFSLQRGAISVAIPPESPLRHLVVATPHATVSVVGTVFRVALLGEGASSVTEVSVDRGRVHVSARDGQEVWLSAGERWRSDGPRAAAAEPAKAASEPSDPASETETPAPAGRASGTATTPSTLGEQNRLYKAALDARNAGDDARTVSLLDTLITRFPQSPLRQEAEVERFRALSRIGRGDEAMRAARRYLGTYESGFARDEAEALALPSAQGPSSSPP
jgi:hypothetical protein